jgi:hypothetical protein
VHIMVGGKLSGFIRLKLKRYRSNGAPQGGVLVSRIGDKSSVLRNGYPAPSHSFAHGVSPKSGQSPCCYSVQ